MDTNIEESSSPAFSTENSDGMKKLANKELNEVIQNALLDIPMEYRMVFSLREIMGFNVAETADTLNISEGNVKVRLNRAKTMLRKQIETIYSREELFEFNLVYCDQMVERVMKIIIANN